MFFILVIFLILLIGIIIKYGKIKGGTGPANPDNNQQKFIDEYNEQIKIFIEQTMNSIASEAYDYKSCNIFIPMLHKFLTSIMPMPQMILLYKNAIKHNYTNDEWVVNNLQNVCKLFKFTYICDNHSIKNPLIDDNIYNTKVLEQNIDNAEIITVYFIYLLYINNIANPNQLILRNIILNIIVKNPQIHGLIRSLLADDDFNGVNFNYIFTNDFDTEYRQTLAEIINGTITGQDKLFVFDGKKYTLRNLWCNYEHFIY